MFCSMRERRRLADIALMAFGIAYPAIVFFLRGAVDPALFILLALTIVALRLTLGNNGLGGWRPALIAAAAALVGMALVDSTLAARAYPVLISLAAAAVFAVTLFQPSSLVERFALASGQRWSADLRIYCRNVTVIWVLWLGINAAVAARLAFDHDDAAWALWTGVLSYLVSAALLGGEWMVRRAVAGRQAR